MCSLMFSGGGSSIGGVLPVPGTNERSWIARAPNRKFSELNNFLRAKPANRCLCIAEIDEQQSLVHCARQTEILKSCRSLGTVINNSSDFRRGQKRTAYQSGPPQTFCMRLIFIGECLLIKIRGSALLALWLFICGVRSLSTTNHSSNNMVRKSGMSLKFFSPASAKNHDSSKSALIILNSPIPSPPSPLFRRLWESADLRVCADGGANRLFQATGKLADKNYVPDIIRGDLDSLRQDVRKHYEGLGTDVQRDPSQDTNDLDKALQVCKGKSLTQIIVYGAFGGRFDQEMASFQALYVWATEFDHQVFLYSDETFGFLVPGDERDVTISLPFFGEDCDPEKTKDSVGEGPTCGLIPLSCKCDRITTKGLKWNLDGSCPLEFGGLVSTSNRVMEEKVEIRSSHPIVFTAEVFSGA